MCHTYTVYRSISSNYDKTIYIYAKIQELQLTGSLINLLYYNIHNCNWIFLYLLLLEILTGLFLHLLVGGIRGLGGDDVTAISAGPRAFDNEPYAKGPGLIDYKIGAHILHKVLGLIDDEMGLMHKVI